MPTPKTKTRKKSTINYEKELAKELRLLSKEIKKLKGLEFIKVLKHPWKLMFYSLLKGMMAGFGSVLGATVIVALFIYLLSQISFVPIIGDFVQEILGQITSTEEIVEPVEADPLLDSISAPVPAPTPADTQAGSTKVNATVPPADFEEFEE